MTHKQGKGFFAALCLLAALIPFALAFIFSSFFTSDGGLQFLPQLKVFFLFVETALVTGYFAWHRQYRAAAHLWGTILFLWLLSLTVPFLASRSGEVLDSADFAFEMGTPLYIFMSCLAAAWLLPKGARIAARILCVGIIFLYMFIQVSYIGYYLMTGALLSVNMLIAVAQTNLSEAWSFVALNMPYMALFGGTAALLLLAWLLMRMSRVSFSGLHHVSGRVRLVVVLLLAVNCIIAETSASGTRIAQVYSDTKVTLDSFGEYQKMVEERKHMEVADPAVVARLKAVPDGVYVLVIGESLARDHMNVYGYPRENTPFQTEAAKDSHYTFFTNTYSSYTQTVQSLTYALTEKNQYNDMSLTDAYSIIDMARAAGFTTTWISNQSRYGVWDTPIGAIGSACDVQHWVNQNVGSMVTTSDYDGALVPYLKKADPQNRRQLIVLHLMGSHVNYWDRYPGEYYHYPEKKDQPRDQAQVMIDEYDNSVLYNDHVMKEIMDVAVNDLRADGVMYFSDHGEQVAARPGHNADEFDFTMVRVPFWIYTSDRYALIHPQTEALMKERKGTPFTNDMIYNALMGLMGIKAAHYDGESDILSGDYVRTVNDLTTMYGSRDIRDDVEMLQVSKQ